MIKLIFMLKRKAGLSPQQFRDHYEGSHALMAQRFAGHLIERYDRNYIMDIAAPPTRKDAVPHPFDYDVITEMRFRSKEDMEQTLAIFAGPEAAPLFREDEDRFLDRDSILMLTCDEVNTGTMAIEK